jgi:hypothetical protein
MFASKSFDLGTEIIAALYPDTFITKPNLPSSSISLTNFRHKYCRRQYECAITRFAVQAPHDVSAEQFFSMQVAP